ncbi:MAG: DnaJ domain-containing protein [Bacteroidota bacterium]
MTTPNYYQILGVSAMASQKEIKAAFKKLAVALHPDKNPGNAAQAEELFKQINEAYQVLSNPEKRTMYDLKLYYATLPPVPHYPEQSPDSQTGYTAPNYNSQRRPYAESRARYASRIEFEPRSVQKMYFLIGLFFALIIIGSIYFVDFSNRWNAKQSYHEAIAGGKSIAAMLKFSEAIGFDKEFWPAYYERGKLRIELMGDYRHAWYDFNATILYTDSLTASMYYNRGLCSYQLNHYPDAVADLDQAIKLDAQSGLTYYLRSLTYLALQDTTQACKNWQEALRLGLAIPDDARHVYCP